MPMDHDRAVAREVSCGDGHSCPSGRAQLDLQCRRSRPTFTKPLQFFTKLYATFLVHPGLLRQESK